MATIVTGTPGRNERHSMLVAPIGLLVSVAVPAAVVIGGIAAEGWGGISWAGAVVWGVVATVAFTAFSIMGKATGMTSMHLLDLLGSVVASPWGGPTRRSWPTSTSTGSADPRGVRSCGSWPCR